MRRKRWRAVPGLGLALVSSLSSLQTAYAFHGLREELSDLLGPTAWGIYLIVPVPFLIVGIIALLLYRASRASISEDEPRDPKGPR
jgi:hypothetical protein